MENTHRPPKGAVKYPFVMIRRRIHPLSDRPTPAKRCEVDFFKEAIDYLNVEVGDRVQLKFAGIDRFLRVLPPESKEPGTYLVKTNGNVQLALRMNAGCIFNDVKSWPSGCWELKKVSEGLFLMTFKHE